MKAASIMTVAGSDSGGGAGIQADLRTFSMYGCHGVSAITALTAQNTRTVSAVFAPSGAFVAEQISCLRDDFKISAAKTGMLFNREIVLAVAESLADKDFPLVVDPVLVSKSGANLLMPEAVEALATRILPLADLITPNLPEAELLAGMHIASQDDCQIACGKILQLGPKAVLLKGGHADFAGADRSTLIDWLAFAGEPPQALEVQRIATQHTHGTGCTLSAAIAAGLGLGFSIKEAVRKAQTYLGLCLGNAFALGKGVSPMDHLAPYRLGRLGEGF